MLTHPTVDQLVELGLAGMARAFAELRSNQGPRHLDPAECLALRLNRAATERSSRGSLALKIIEERYGHGATIITSQIPVDPWHDVKGRFHLAPGMRSAMMVPMSSR